MNKILIEAKKGYLDNENIGLFKRKIIGLIIECRNIVDKILSDEKESNKILKAKQMLYIYKVGYEIFKAKK